MNKIDKKNKYICMTGSRFGANCSRISHATKAGFSLVEVLLSLVVLSVGISAVTVLMMTNTKNSINTRNQIIASELAQEGIELVRNYRDNNPALFLPLTTGSNYRMDYAMGTPASDADTFAEKRLYMNGGFFSHTSTAESTNFYRMISITDDVGKKTITSYVIWSGAVFPVTCNFATSCVSSISVLTE